jgi:hypothetical protein
MLGAIFSHAGIHGDEGGAGARRRAVAHAFASDRRKRARVAAADLRSCTAAAFSSALLVFLVQPMVARMVLPDFGARRRSGSPRCSSSRSCFWCPWPSRARGSSARRGPKRPRPRNESRGRCALGACCWRSSHRACYWERRRSSRPMSRPFRFSGFFRSPSTSHVHRRLCAEATDRAGDVRPRPGGAHPAHHLEPARRRERPDRRGGRGPPRVPLLRRLSRARPPGGRATPGHAPDRVLRAACAWRRPGWSLQRARRPHDLRLRRGVPARDRACVAASAVTDAKRISPCGRAGRDGDARRRAHCDWYSTCRPRQSLP